MSENKGGKLSVKLQNLHLHPLVERQTELLATLQFALSSIKELSTDALMWLINFHPIFVIIDKTNKYQVICGIRTFNIAARLLPASSEVRVTLVVDQPTEVINAAIYADLYLTPLALSLRHPAKSLADIYRIVPVNLAQKLTPKMSRSKTAFSRGLDVATNTLYYPHSKRGVMK